MSNAKTICTVCNYIYDEALGVPEQGIPPATKFEALSEKWACPECSSPKDMFQPCSCVSYAVFEQTCDAHHRDVHPENTVNFTPPISKHTPVGDLVAQRPTRACVLEQYGIDYCCGGKATLEEACAKKGVQLEQVLEKLIAADRDDLQPEEPDWTKTNLKELIDHILVAYHEPLRTDLPRIAQLSEKVARVHGANHPEMVKVNEIFQTFKAQLELHINKEEMVLFPGIAATEATGSPQIFGCGGGIEHPIEVMNKEHDDAGGALCAIRVLTNDYTPPADACTTYKVLLFSLAQLESEMHQHVHKENNILFRRALAMRSALVS